MIGVVRLRVTDTETGDVCEYFNPPDQPLQPLLDTDAFATCPKATETLNETTP